MAENRDRKDENNKSVPTEFGKAIFDREDEKPKKRKRISDRAFMTDEKSLYMHNVKKLWKTFRHYIISGVIAIVFLTLVTAFFGAKNYTLGYEVIIDGSLVGYIDNTKVVEDAIKEAEVAGKGFVGQ